MHVHLIGSARTDVKLIIDINEQIFSEDKINALKEAIDFVFASYEKKAPR